MQTVNQADRTAWKPPLLFSVGDSLPILQVEHINCREAAAPCSIRAALSPRQCSPLPLSPRLSTPKAHVWLWHVPVCGARRVVLRAVCINLWLLDPTYLNFSSYPCRAAPLPIALKIPTRPCREFRMRACAACQTTDYILLWWLVCHCLSIVSWIKMYLFFNLFFFAFGFIIVFYPSK